MTSGPLYLYQCIEIVDQTIVKSSVPSLLLTINGHGVIDAVYPFRHQFGICCGLPRMQALVFK
jgi:hypothetical protein